MLKRFTSIMVRSTVRYCSTLNTSKGYKETVIALNSLQSNAATIERARKTRDQFAQYNISKTLRHLEKVGITQTDLDTLNILHISGTKGKGSTCAFVECILHHHGYKTGLFTSPHLVVARERIRISANFISESLFTRYFWEVYNKLDQHRESEDDIPSYFTFLTILAFHTFLKERVDVAIIEVGIGGEYDCTNVFRKPVACGITSLGFDHTAILGKTIEQIAWHKAGIMKPKVPVFTISQPPQAEAVLRSRAKYFNCDLQFCPPLNQYGWGNSPIRLGLSGRVQQLNASLALQLSHAWIKHREHGKTIARVSQESQEADTFILPEQTISGLRNCCLPGRSQVLRRGQVSYYLDGAHTYESILACVDWFSSAMMQVNKKKDICRVLLFNTTGDRDPRSLLRPLVELRNDFHIAIFCPNFVNRVLDEASDSSDFTLGQEKQMKNSLNNMQVWLEMKNSASFYNTESEDAVLNYSFYCLGDALSWICGETSYDVPHPTVLLKASEIHILVTGSMHLVGNVLSVIDPELTGKDLESFKQEYDRAV